MPGRVPDSYGVVMSIDEIATMFRHDSTTPRWADDQLGVAVASALNFAAEVGCDPVKIARWTGAFFRGLDENDGGGLGPASLSVMSEEDQEVHRRGYSDGVWVRTRAWLDR